jgi:hypothetical protein
MVSFPLPSQGRWECRVHPAFNAAGAQVPRRGDRSGCPGGLGVRRSRGDGPGALGGSERYRAWRTQARRAALGDIFCSNQVHLADGRTLAMGGTDWYSDNVVNSTPIGVPLG